jgi:hypothetical protein
MRITDLYFGCWDQRDSLDRRTKLWCSPFSSSARKTLSFAPGDVTCKCLYGSPTCSCICIFMSPLDGYVYGDFYTCPLGGYISNSSFEGDYRVWRFRPNYNRPHKDMLSMKMIFAVIEVCPTAYI